MVTTKMILNISGTCPFTIVSVLKMLGNLPQTVSKIFQRTSRRYCTSVKIPLSDRWRTDKNIIMNTFARKKMVADRYGIEGKSADKSATHVSMNPPRKFHVPKAENETFLQEYSRSIVDGQYMTMLEIPTVCSPLRVDIDVEKLDSSSVVLGEEYIERVMDLYAEESLKYLADSSCPENENVLTSYIMKRKKNYAVEGGTKEGIHAIFPRVVFPTNLHNKLFHIPVSESVQNDLSGEEEFKIVIDQIGRNPWFMFGSQKHCDLHPYTVEYIWKYGEQLLPFTLSLNSESEIFHWVEKFSIRYKPLSQISETASEELRREIQLIEESGEEDLSVYNSLKSKSPLNQIPMRKTNEYFDSQQKVNFTILTPQFINVKNVLELFDEEISDAYKSWSSIGFALKLLCHYSGGCDNDYKELWIEFSKKSRKFDQEECEKVWVSFNPDKGNVFMAKRILMKFANQRGTTKDRNLRNLL